MIHKQTAVKYIIISSVLFYTLVVLFGAPFFSDIVGTAALAASLTAVSAVPAVLLFGSEERLLDVVLSSFSCDSNPTFIESIPLYTSTFGIFGAWAAASVYPLDWDRWWQRYPLPSLSGCLAGASIGLLVCTFQSYYKSSHPNKNKVR